MPEAKIDPEVKAFLADLDDDLDLDVLRELVRRAADLASDGAFAM
jgi:hypothetical protein